MQHVSMPRSLEGTDRHRAVAGSFSEGRGRQRAKLERRRVEGAGEKPTGGRQGRLSPGFTGQLRAPSQLSGQREGRVRCEGRLDNVHLEGHEVIHPTRGRGTASISSGYTESMSGRLRADRSH